jgi:hypothetical protein
VRLLCGLASIIVVVTLAILLTVAVLTHGLLI